VTDWALEKIVPGCGRIYFTAVMQKPAAAGLERQRRVA
jgi:hypothetical protein